MGGHRWRALMPNSLKSPLDMNLCLVAVSLTVCVFGVETRDAVAAGLHCSERRAGARLASGDSSGGAVFMHMIYNL